MSKQKNIVRNLLVILLIIVSVIAIEVSYFDTNKTVKAEETKEVTEEEAEAKAKYDAEMKAVTTSRDAYLHYVQAENGSHTETYASLEETLSKAQQLAALGNYADALEMIADLREGYENEYEEVKSAVEESKEAVKEKEETSTACSTKPTIKCPTRTNEVSGQKISLTKKITIGKEKSKTLGVGFNRSYSYLTYEVKKGSEKYISVEKTTGKVTGIAKTNGATAYVIVTATKEGKIIAQKECGLKVYEEKSKNAEDQDKIKVQEDAIIAEKNLNNNPLGDTCEDEALETTTCKNVSITKGSTKKISKFYSTLIKSNNIKKIEINFVEKKTKVKNM